MAAVASTPLAAGAFRKLPALPAKAVEAALIVAGLVVCTAYLVDGTYNPFLYFRF